MTTEVDRVERDLLRAMMEVPHRAYGPMVAMFRESLRQRPNFAASALAYMCLGGTAIRDQQDASIIALIQADASQFPEFREAARCLLLGHDAYPDIKHEGRIAGLEPFRILRVWHYMTSPHIYTLMVGGQRHEIERFPGEVAARAKLPRIVNRLNDTKNKRRQVLNLGDRTLTADDFVLVFDSGHVRAHNMVRSIMVDWFRSLDQNPRRADGAVLFNRKTIRRAWKYHHFAPCQFPYLHDLLFGDPPEGSKLDVIKRIAALGNDPRAQAELAIENRIPFDVLVSVTGKAHPILGAMLIASMTPTQALNSQAWVARSGLLAIPDLRAAFEGKVSLATRSAASAMHRVSAQVEDEGLKAARQRAIEGAVKRQKEIVGPLLILVDESGTMADSLLAACEFAARTAVRTVEGRMIVGFNQRAWEIEVAGDRSFADHQRAFAGERPGGRTSPAAGLDFALRRGFQPVRILLFTDCGENVGSFARTCARAADSLGHEPQVVIVKLPGDHDSLTPRLDQEGIAYDLFEVRQTGDYSVFDNVTNVLTGRGPVSIVETIRETRLPSRAGVTLFYPPVRAVPAVL